MSEVTKNKYTLETLLPLNVSYDRDRILIQQDVDMVNILVEVIEGSRSNLIPKVGDRMHHVDRDGDFYRYALLENFLADKMLVCLAQYVPFVSISDPDIWLSVSGGPFTSIDPTEMKFIGWEDGVFSAWGHCGPCANGSVRFMAKVAKWEYSDPEPLYGDFTTETWRKLYVRINDNPESRYRYVANGTAFRDDADFDKFKKNYEATVFNHSESMLVVWCFRDKTEFLPEDEWNRLDLPVQERIYNGQLVKIKIKKDMERHVTTFYRIELPPITY